MVAQSMERLAELGAGWFSLLLLAAWRTMPLFVLVAALSLTFRKKFSPAVHAILWTVVVARLVLPVSLGSPVSLHGPIDAWLSATDDDAPKDVVTEPALAILASSEAYWANATNHHERPYQLDAVPTYAWDELLVIAMSLILLCVTGAMLIRGVVSHVRFALRLRSCRQLNDQQLIDTLLRECDAIGVGRRPLVREVPLLSAPAVFGLVRHTICLPVNFVETLTEQELRWVLRHELAHVRRRDLAVMVLASLAGACHWFNPVVWFTVRSLRAAIESAADRLALAGSSRQDAVTYGQLLLRIAQQSDSTRAAPVLGLLPFASGKRFKRRIELLTHSNKSPRFAARVSAVALVVSVALMGLTDAREVNRDETPEVYLPTGGWSLDAPTEETLDPWTTRNGDGPVFLVRYDISQLLDSIPQEIKTSGQDLKSQLAMWVPGLPSDERQLQLDGKTVIAHLNARQHKHLAQTFEIWRQGEPTQISVEVRLIETTIQIAEMIDWIGNRIEAIDVQGPRPAMAARVTDSVLGKLVRTVSSDRQGNILFAPKVTCYDGQTAAICDQTRRPFVTGVKANSDGKVAPVVSERESGIKIELTPRTKPNDRVELEFDVCASSIRKVSFANLPVRLPDQPAPHVTVQVPTTDLTGVSSQVDLALGESVVVAIPRIFDAKPGSDAGRVSLVSLTPRAISLSGAVAPPMSSTSPTSSASPVKQTD